MGIAAAVVVLCSVIWFRPQAGPSTSPSSDTNIRLGQVLTADYNSDNNSPDLGAGGLGPILAADYNSVRLPDINALDSNGLN